MIRNDDNLEIELDFFDEDYVKRINRVVYNISSSSVIFNTVKIDIIEDYMIKIYTRKQEKLIFEIILNENYKYFYRSNTLYVLENYSKFIEDLNTNLL